MTLMELASRGYGIVLLAIVVLGLVSSTGRARGLVDVCWGLVLVAAAGASAWRLEALTSRHLLALALLGVWAVGYTLGARRATAEIVLVNTRVSARRWIVCAFELFLALAPMLTVLSDPQDAAWSWSESLALALAAGGYLLVASGARAERWLRRDPVVIGFIVSFMSIYALALGSPTGALTVFAPLVIARRSRRVLGSPLTALRQARPRRGVGGPEAPAFEPR
jgi:hypothetical protein